MLNDIEDATKLMEQECADTFHNINKSWLYPERIIDQIKRGKYYLVKWKQLDHNNCTWEHQEFIRKYYNNLRLDFIKLTEQQKLVNLSRDYRLSLMRGREDV